METQYDVFRTEMVQIKTEIQNIHMKVGGGENTSQLMETKTEVSRWKRKQKSVDGNENRSQLMETKTEVS